jgi:predicted methyltransferase
MQFLKEINNLDAIQLSDAQQAVLAVISASATPKLAKTNITNNVNIKAASYLLAKLGAVKFVSDGVELTDKGREQVISYNIANDDGSLTDVGSKLVNSFKINLDGFDSLQQS